MRRYLWRPACCCCSCPPGGSVRLAGHGPAQRHPTQPGPGHLRNARSPRHQVRTPVRRQDTGRAGVQDRVGTTLQRHPGARPTVAPAVDASNDPDFMPVHRRPPARTDGRRTGSVGGSISRPGCSSVSRKSVSLLIATVLCESSGTARKGRDTRKGSDHCL
eukprot:SAG22_NODE_321_length_12398_cov_3.218392_6_plen_161_part_00